MTGKRFTDCAFFDADYDQKNFVISLHATISKEGKLFLRRVTC